jgi:uncharacterized protein (UPF0332 family)
MAREELQTAEDNIAAGHYRAAISRSYYAVFYMASAALFTQSIVRGKHSGVESAFSEVLIKPGLVTPDFGRIYQRARRSREEVDYAEDAAPDRDTAQRVADDAATFVDGIEQFLRNSGALD